MSEDTPSRLSSALDLIGEPVRARMLRLLEREELGVGELGRALGLPQSTVSRHVKELHTKGFVDRRAQGTATLLRMTGDALSPEVLKLWELVRDDPDARYVAEEDAQRLEKILAERQGEGRTFFGRVASGWDALRDGLFGRSFALPAALALLDPAWTVVDLG